ncbi:hypothetical protein [Candidatus Binatus sp.]|uniref:hypothetical protein n=1 Tax=Candidatus Binatus sp. TaxID=2811406 RepID=UPI003BB10FBF
MKTNKMLAFAMFAAVTLTLAGPACAGSAKAAVHASSVRSASTVAAPSVPAGSVAGPAGVRQLAALRANNRRFVRPYYPYNGYGYGYGNQVYLNPDEADWAEQWRSLREENNGPYARSTWGNPQGEARLWEFPDDTTAAKPSK